MQGAVAGMGEDMYEAAHLLAHGRIKTEPFRQHVWPSDKIQQAMESFI